MLSEASYIRLNKRVFLQQHLYKFLILYRRLDIPHVGSFIIEDEPARVDADSGLLFAPKPVIRFHESSQQQHPDKVFFHFLAEELVVDEIAAIREFHDYCFAFRNNIHEHNMAALGGIGRINKRSEGDLFFTPENNLLELLPPVPWSTGIVAEVKIKKTAKRQKESIKEERAEEPATEVIEESEEEIIIPADRWWIYAILLLAAGVLAMLFYYQ